MLFLGDRDRFLGKRQSDLQKMHLAVFAISVAVVVVGLGLKFLDIAMR